MDLGSRLGLISGAIAAAVPIYGAAVLLTGRAVHGDQRAFRRLTDAGLFYQF
jgi:hypothetical protein